MDFANNKVLWFICGIRTGNGYRRGRYSSFPTYRLLVSSDLYQHLDTQLTQRVSAGIAGVCGTIQALMMRAEKGGSYTVDVSSV
jgi:hypothetical protein